jgi:hypothetical protein
MEHKGVQYQVVQTANPTGWKWTVELGNGRTKTGDTFSRVNGIRLALLAIDRAVATSSG